MMSWPRGQKGFPCVHACSRWRAETRKNMLRYQNKYRSVLKTRPALVRKVIEEMRENGEATFDPYAAQSAQAQPLHDSIAIRVQSSGDRRCSACCVGSIRS